MADNPWQAERKTLVFTGVGGADFLLRPLTAFVASRQCPGTCIRAATDWALRQARERSAVVSGFHSPLEQSVLRLQLEARSPAVLVLARPVTQATLRSAWRVAIATGSLTVVSQATKSQRLTQDAAELRNDLAAHLADRIVVAHAQSGGHLAAQCERWAGAGLDLRCMDGTEWPAA
ncbi:MAG: DNA-processing protein DprA [Burkholderiaceae bacterium]|nr:DNA-processing protein DprA [Burkholderiaceae bacterium]